MEVRAYSDRYEAYAMQMPILAALVFGLVYAGAVALSIPIAALLSVLAGFMFGSVWGTVIVVISATVGATATFILARYFFRDFFERKASRFVGTAEAEARLNGFSDVLIARLIPAVPFSLINAVAGLTRVSLRNYVLATALGIIPFTFVYVHAGEALGIFDSLSQVASSEGWIFASRIAIVVVAIYIVQRIYKARTTK
jgi:uncharacterized membrane protein YdjX (TVP38/TMEM64 family)